MRLKKYAAEVEIGPADGLTDGRHEKGRPKKHLLTVPTADGQAGRLMMFTAVILQPDTGFLITLSDFHKQTSEIIRNFKVNVHERF